MPKEVNNFNDSMNFVNSTKKKKERKKKVGYKVASNERRLKKKDNLLSYIPKKYPGLILCQQRSVHHSKGQKDPIHWQNHMPLLSKLLDISVLVSREVFQTVLVFSVCWFLCIVFLLVEYIGGFWAHLTLERTKRNTNQLPWLQ